MNMSLLPQLVVSSTRGWPELVRTRPSIASIFVQWVLPVSIVPPLMLYLAGTHEAVFKAAAITQWHLLALLVFLAEMISFAAMGWVIQKWCRNYDVEVSIYDAYLVAAISPLPLWLSFLALVVPSLAFAVTIAAVALIIYCGIVYHGVFALGKIKEQIVAAAITLVVAATGLFAWVMLTLVAMLPPH